MNGTLVPDDTPGGGLTMILTLPAAMTPAAPEARDAMPGTRPPTRRSPVRPRPGVPPPGAEPSHNQPVSQIARPRERRSPVPVRWDVSRRGCDRWAGGGAPGSLVGIHHEDRTGEVGGVHGVETILFLVVPGTVVAAFAGRLRVPAPSLLVIAGLVVGLLPGFPPVHVPPDVVSLVVLPPLLYAASEELPWRDLRAVWRPVAVLSVGLVLASAAAVAVVTWAVAAVPVSMAFVLGAVLASTDPVAVSALGRRLSLPPKVQALVQAESLFNDATSLVLFQIAVRGPGGRRRVRRAAPGARPGRCPPWCPGPGPAGWCRWPQRSRSR